MKCEVVASLLLIILAGTVICSADPGDRKAPPFPHHTIRATIDTGTSRVQGTVIISAHSATSLTVARDKLRILSVVIGGKTADVDTSSELLTLKTLKDDTVEIRFEGTFQSSPPSEGSATPGNVIDDRGVFLTGTWFPRIPGLFTYDLTLTFPKGYRAVSEAEETTLDESEDSVQFAFTFPHPSEEVSIVAAKRYEIAHEKHRGVNIATYLFPEEGDLAKTYIDHTKKYLDLYEQMFGPFPFKRFAIVESFLPAGSSMPTMTVLGQDVVRLPFIVETSLGHEILHQWFGNMVYVDESQGNWAEGLTTYLADHLYEEQKGNGWVYRKQMLIDFGSYVSGARDVPLQTFTGRVDSATRSIGYGKAAMVFHMLHTLVGKERFSASLRDFVAGHGFRRASWGDIQRCFEQASGENLSWFFDQWVSEPGAPDLAIENMSMKWNGTAYETRFDLVQRGRAYRLTVPVTFISSAGPAHHTVEIDSDRKSFEIFLEDLPEKMVLDGGYDLFRALSSDEFPPVMSRLLGAETLVIVPPPSEADRYAALGQVFGHARAAQADDVTFKDMGSSSFLLLGVENPLVKRLFGRIPAGPGFTLTVRKNPSSPLQVVGIASADSAQEVEAAARKLTHYGRYSRVSFEEGRNSAKETAASGKGIEKDLAGQTAAIEPPPVKTLSHVTASIRDKTVIYVGEAHDRFAHHVVQLEIIKALHRSGRTIGIGMEMFQRPFQKALDDFLASKIDEREFLARSEYFKRWGYDYNLYKPILEYARKEKIPVIALNLRREITEKVAKGGIDALTPEEKSELPKEMDFSDQEYRDRLYEIFKSHPSSRDGNFDFFVQNQLLWDETMAESVGDFLRERPDHQMIVLAGNGHIAYGSGIPKRVLRRNGMSYATVMNDGEPERGVADYLVSSKPVEVLGAPKMMVLLDDKGGQLTVTGFPEHSVSEKAGMLKGDVLLTFDGKEIPTVQDLRLELYFRKKGDTVTVRVRRQEPEEGETTTELKVTL
jgi:uncharacterized iron-regulated protein